MKTTEMPGCECPNCGYRLEASTSITRDTEPKPGDFSICFGCAAVLRFTDDLRVRTASDPEIELLDPEFRRLLHAAVQGIKEASNRNEEGRQS